MIACDKCGKTFQFVGYGGGRHFTLDSHWPTYISSGAICCGYIPPPQTWSWDLCQQCTGELYRWTTPARTSARYVNIMNLPPENSCGKISACMCFQSGYSGPCPEHGYMTSGRCFGLLNIPPEAVCGCVQAAYVVRS